LGEALRFSEKLAILGGADREILKQVPTAVSQFVQFALVLLSTAIMAGISMWFALVQGMSINPILAIPFAAFWGLVILNLDRYLTSSMQSATSFIQAFGMAIPRLLMAALIGAVVSTPLVLKVFESDINAEMAYHNIQQSAENSKPLDASAFKQNVDRLQAEVTRLQQIRAGNIGEVASPPVAAAKQRVADLEQSVTQQTEVADEAQKLYICERYGTGRESLKDPSKCSPTAGPYGPFPQIEANFNSQVQILRDLEGQLQQARDQVSAETAIASGQQADALKSAQSQASEQLPTMEAQLASARAQLAQIEEQVGSATLNDTGILAQLRALYSLGETNPLMNAAHWAIGALFFMIELLPVIVKIMLSSGPPSLYERVRKLDGDSLADEAKVRRNADRRRIEEESKKRRDIEDDMRAREKQLGIKANVHVAGEMEKILELALKRWSHDVSFTLNQTSHANTSVPTSAGPADSDGASTERAGSEAASTAGSNGGGAAAVGLKILKKFNIPSGDKLN
jgi:hypothetical protein